LEHENFASLQEQAYVVMHEACRLDGNNAKFHYMLALQAAEMGYMEQAAEHVKTALKINHAHIPSWHLMALMAIAAKKSTTTELEMIVKALQVWQTAVAAVTDGWQLVKTPPRTFRRQVLDVLPRQYCEEWLKYVCLV
jgi:cellobiose-specific phosphotransferase system component IIA